MKTTNCESICKFSLKEKLYAQFSFNGGIIIGAYGLLQHSRTLAVLYLLYSYVGIILLMRYTVCPRCPHLKVAGDCLQLHPSLTKKIISPNRKGPLNRHEKFLFVTVLYGILIIPLYWIASNLFVLIPFLILYGGLLLSLLLYFCRYCRNTVCIQNQYKKFTASHLA